MVQTLAGPPNLTTPYNTKAWIPLRTTPGAPSTGNTGTKAWLPLKTRNLRWSKPYQVLQILQQQTTQKLGSHFKQLQS